MKSELLATLITCAALTGCASVAPEYRMVPSGEHGVGVRFSHGNAAMISNGPAGSVMLLPVRYNSTSKMFFALAAFNTSGTPVNFGTEDVRILLEDGTPLYVQDYNFLRHQERLKAQHDLNAAWIDAGVEGYLAYRNSQGLPDPVRRQIAYRTASGSYAVDAATIEIRLRHAMSAWGRHVLQTTTIDPGAAFGGYVFADQLLIPEGTHRQVIVEINFAGSPHRFTLNLVPSGTDFPVPTGIPATPRQTVQTMQRTPETWHWIDEPPPSKVDGMTVIE
ncbi:hypothetical protein [Brevundimonas nasdae]|uniref:hypothetical protein n=1 Tax=Brevundimonas nasdae TaxID=172043 RepID=UPI0028A28EF1|nr:hypothetical protein [Brevundimonas nasdae]